MGQEWEYVFEFVRPARSGSTYQQDTALFSGWDINGSSFYRDGATDSVSSGMSADDYSFYAGAKYANRAIAPFKVTRAGVVYATGAIVNGDFKTSATVGITKGIWISSSNNEMYFYGDRGDGTIMSLASIGIATYGTDTVIGWFGTPTSSRIALFGQSSTAQGVFGVSDSDCGVLGQSASSAGVAGSSTSGSGVYGSSTTGYGVQGVSSSYPGVYGSSTTGAGTYGTTSSGTGAYGNSSSGVGVHGNSTSGYGVYGVSSTNIGVYASSTDTYGLYVVSTSGTYSAYFNKAVWINSGQVVVYQATGTAPFAVNSTTVCSNLNADLWDGYHFGDYINQAVKSTSSPQFSTLTLTEWLYFGNYKGVMVRNYANDAWKYFFFMGTDDNMQLCYDAPVGIYIGAGATASSPVYIKVGGAVKQITIDGSGFLKGV